MLGDLLQQSGLRQGARIAVKKASAFAIASADPLFDNVGKNVISDQIASVKSRFDVPPQFRIGTGDDAQYIPCRDNWQTKAVCQ